MTAIATPVEDAPVGAVEALAAGGFRLGANAAAAFAIALLCTTLALYHVYHAVFGENESLVHNMGHLTLILPLCFLLRPFGGGLWSGRSARGWAVDLPLIALSVASGLYVLHDPFAFHMRAGYPEARDILAGALLIGLIFQATRRTVGIVLVCVASFFLLHALTASHWPGFFFGRSQSWWGLIEQIYLSGNGIFGIPLTVMASILGVTAFIIADSLGVSYLSVAVAANPRDSLLRCALFCRGLCRATAADRPRRAIGARPRRAAAGRPS